LNWITDKVSLFWNWIKTPFVKIANKLKTIFGGINYQNISKLAKEILYNLMFPLVGIQKVTGWLVDKFKSIPIVGKALSKLGSFISDVQTGELSNKYAESVGVKTSAAEKALKARELEVQRIQRGLIPTYERYGSSKYKNMENRIKEIQEIPGYSRELPNYNNQTKGILNRSAASQSTSLRMEQKRNDELKKELNKINEGAKQTSGAVIQSIQSNNVTNNRSSNVNNVSGGGYRGNENFSDAYNLSRDIAACNMQ